MKTFSLVTAALLCASTLVAQDYNITLSSTLSFPGQDLANIWGYAANGKEYALVGADQGMVIVDVTNPNTPVIITQLTDGINNDWREIKTYENYAYITSEGTDAGNQGGVGIADLSNLPSSSVPFHKYHGDGVIANQLKRAHALHIDEQAGYAYIYGTTGLANSGAVCLNLNSDPYNPVYAGQYSGAYIHDGYVGNNLMYAARIWAGDVAVIDFTNKTSPQVLATQTTPNAFTHNTWPSADGQYLFTTDEKSGAYLTAYDVSDVNNIVETDRIQTTPGSGSIVHNTYIKDHFAVTSWYKDGVTITDVSRPGNLIQVGSYDTYTSGSGNGFEGAWGVYPYLPSGNILVSNIWEGSGGKMYVLTPAYVSACYLEGNIKDGSNNQNLSGVSVAIQYANPLNSTTSKLDGNYATGQPTAGNFNVIFSKTGYVTKTLSVTLASGEVTLLNITMLPQSLPLELTSFTARAEGRVNVLEWETAFEQNTLRYEIEVLSSAAGEWKKIGEVPAAGNSASPRNYFFTDNYPAQKSHYRLRTVDLDGKEQFSYVVVVTRPAEAFRLVNLFPTPTSGNLKVEITSDRERSAELVIINLTGQVLLEQPLELISGSNFHQLQLPKDWPSGKYFIQVESEKESRTGTFILRR